MSIIAARRKKIHKPNTSTRSLWDAITTVAAEYRVMTVRQLYYQMEMRGYVAKDDKDYDKVQRACLQMRRQGALPYEKIVDSSRERRTIYQHGGLHQALEEAARSYRRNYWLDQPIHVEVWCEKDALTSIMNPVCQRYGVAFQALRGFDSESFAYESAKEMQAIGKPAQIFYFGDHDPSGWWIARNLEPTLREFGADASVMHVGVTPRQVRGWGLPQRHAKKTDTRLAGFVRHFGSELCTEVDAIPPNTLEALIKSSIESMIEPEAWYRVSRDEKLERETLDSIARAGWKPGILYRVSDEDSDIPKPPPPPALDAVLAAFEDITAPQPIGPCQFVPGQRVLHAVFGEGIVVSAKPTGDDEVVTVSFIGKGVKRLLSSLAKLQPT